jgi:hypothetical protein
LGVRYDEFRCGYSYSDAWRMLFVASEDRSKWVHKGPGAVLSLLRKLKQDAWDELCRRVDPETLPPPPPRPPPSTAPFRSMVEAMLAQDPNVSGVAILQRAREQGYRGSLGTLRALVKTLRPLPTRKKAAPFRDLVEEMLRADPSVSTVAVLGRAREQGFDGSIQTVRRLVATLRPTRREPHRAARRHLPRRPPSPARPLPALLTVRAAARLLGVSEDCVLVGIARCSFPGAFRSGRGWRSWLIPLADVTGPDPAPASEAW